MTFHQRFGEFRKQAHRNGFTAKEWAQVCQAASIVNRLKIPALRNPYLGVTLAHHIEIMNDKQKDKVRELTQ